MEKKRSCCCGVLPATGWWLLTLLGLPALFLLMLNSRQGAIENDLASRADAGLKAEGMDWAKANLAGRGRDLQLTGTAASEEERDQAGKVVQGVYGVRDVQNLIEVAVSETAAVTTDFSAPDMDAQAQAPTAQTLPEGSTAPEMSSATETSATSASPEQSVASATPEASGATEQSGEDAGQGRQLAATDAEPQSAAATPEPSAEEQAARDCQQQLNDAMSGKTILFETNKAAIKQDSIALLDSLAGIMSTCKGVIAERGIQVSGHTDNVGNDAYNQKLSQRRADAVRNYLVRKGIDGGLIKSVGYGESKPIASNDSEEGRSQNRRITFEISPE